jgi:hypothetical protein
MPTPQVINPSLKKSVWRIYMKNQIAFLLKLLILSTAISCLIKYIGPMFLIPETSTNAIILVFLPTIIMATVLIGRIPLQKQN